MQNKTPAQTVALGQFLSEYPHDATFSEVLELIENKADSVTIWEPFEYWPPEDVTAQIEDLRYNVEKAIQQTIKA